MRRTIILGILLFIFFWPSALYSQQFTPVGKRLTLSFVMDVETLTIAMRDRVRTTSIPDGFTEPNAAGMVSIWDFRSTGALQYTYQFGGTITFVYRAFDEEFIEFDEYAIQTTDYQWYRAIDADGKEIYFYFTYSESKKLFAVVYDMQRGFNLRMAVHEVIGIE